MNPSIRVSRLHRRVAICCAALVFGNTFAPTSSAEPAAPHPRKLVGEETPEGVLVTTNQIVTPLGKVQRIEGARPKDMAVSPDGSLVAVLTTSKVILYTPDGTMKTS